MTEQQGYGSTTGEREPLAVLIAGGGVAALEAAFALRELAGDRVAVTLLSDSDEFVYRPLAIGEPFTASVAQRYPLTPLASAAGAKLVRDTAVHVDSARRVVHTAAGLDIGYDALLVGVGAEPLAVSDHATTVDPARMDELLHGLVQDVEEGYVRRLAIVVPAPVPWPLPAYELALMASERAWDMQTGLDVTLLTPERTPLEMFGGEASRALAELLADRRIDVVTSAYSEIPRAQTVVVHPGGRSISATRVIALPQLRGRGLDGLPQDGGGFIPVDEYGRVRGVDRVWAAGDATDVPIKQGGVAAQLADTAAMSIAALAGASTDPLPFEPVLEGVLMTGGTPRYLRYQPAAPGLAAESLFTEVPRGTSRPKIAARYLAPRLRGAQSPTVPASA
jgi:sulfide:quinone oxidoreductase